jgi:bis(5'-nucleosidyl)-tetraphosphatase
MVINTTYQNKAFNSLSFRGNRGYPTTLKLNFKKQQQNKQDVYGAILYTKDKITDELLYVLVQGRYTGKWSFPKGHINNGELPIQCALREIEEETGINNLLSISNNTDLLEYKHIYYGNYYLIYLPEKIDLNPRDQNEIIDAKWVTINEMRNMLLNADVNIYIKNI